MANNFLSTLRRLSLTVSDIRRKGFFHLLSANILLRIIGFGSQLLIVKLLSPTELGQIKTLQTFYQIALVVAAFGFNTAILKLCSESRPLEERSAILRNNVTYSLVSTVIVMLAVFIIARVGLLSPDKNINTLFLYFMWSIPAGVILSLLVAYLTAIKQVKKMAASQIVFRLLGITMIISLTWQYGMKGFVLGSVVAGYIFLPMLLIYIREFITTCKRKKITVPGFRNVFYYAKWSLLAKSVHRLSHHMDILLLNYMIADREGFGYYSIATIFLIPFREITASVRSISVPYLSEKQNNKFEFMRVINKYRKLMLLQAIGITIAALIIVPFIVQQFYGEKYADVSTYFSILVFGYIFQSYIALLPTSLMTLGLIKYNFYSAVIYFPITFLLNYFMIRYYGLIGAAFAQVLASIVIMLVIINVSNKAIKYHFDQLR